MARNDGVSDPMNTGLLQHYAPYLVGLAAGVTALWGQARNFVKYLSSFLIVQSTHDQEIAHALAWHFRVNYSRPPSGLYAFRSLILPIRTSTIYRIVPFLMPSKTTAYWGKRGLFLFDGESGHVTGIRWMSQVEGLISDALDHYHEVTQQETSVAPLVVIKVMGSMGDTFDQYRKFSEAAQTGSPGGPAPSSAQVVGNWNHPDLRIDRSFKYGPADFATGGGIDPFRGLFYDKITLDLVGDAVRWRDHQDWYLERGIPWRRGWLLHGPGGTGKSSMAKAIAQKLRLPIYQFYLSTLNDKEFVREWEKMAAPCMALFEDFDNVFDLREPQTEHRSLTFDCILNQIQGVSSINGVLLVVTTNRIERIDPALGQVDDNGMATRPGRIDRIVHFGKTDERMRAKIAQFIMPDFPDHHAGLIAEGHDTTPAQFQHMCIEAAFNLLNGPANA